MVKECQDDGGEREEEENAESRKSELNFEDLQQGGEENGHGVTVKDGKEQSVENVPRNFLGNRLHHAAASQGVVAQRHSTSLELLTLS